MRPLTPFVSYLDNAGHPLVGRVRFCNPDASPAEVFAEDGTTSLGSSVFTESSGRLVQQPFLEDHDYLLFFDKYVGHATMTEDDDTDNWPEQGSAIDRYNSIGIETDGATVTPVSNISALRNMNPDAASEFDGVKTVSLLGYNSAGDKPAVTYVWKPSLTDPDNGGSVIKVSSIATGRWVLQDCPVKLDVRHFGAFPSGVSTANPTQRYAIHKADAYAHSHQCGLYFYADEFAVFYDISGLTIHDVDCNNDARLYSVDSDTKSCIVGIEQIFLGGSGTGRIELVAPTVRTSWENGYHYADLNPSEKLIVDAPLYGVPRQWSGIIVEMGVYCGPNMTFDNCEIVSRGVISGNITLKNIDIKTEWFADGYSWSNLSMIGCTVRLHNCKDATTYVTLKNYNNEPDYGDLGEQTVTGATLLAGCVAENAYFVNVTIQGATELHNVTGTVLTDANSLPQLNAVDCWLTFADSSDFTVTGLTLNRGAISASNKMFVTAENPTSAAPIIVTIKDAEINCEMEVSYAQLHLERNIVNDDILHVGQMNSISEVIVGNTFNAQLKISNLQETGLPPAGVVHAVWKDNIGNVSDPLVIDHAKIKTTDSEHGYVYEGNTGTFKSSASAHYVITLNVAYNRDTAATTNDTISKQDEWLILVSRMYDDGLVAKRGFPPVEIFRVGTDSFAVNVRWTPVPFSGSSQGTDVPGTMIPYEFRMVAEYVDGTYCTFKPITVYGGEPPASGQHKDRSTFIGQCLNVSSIDGISFYADVTISVTP